MPFFATSLIAALNIVSAEAKEIQLSDIYSSACKIIDRNLPSKALEKNDHLCSALKFLEHRHYKNARLELLAYDRIILHETVDYIAWPILAIIYNKEKNRRRAQYYFDLSTLALKLDAGILSCANEGANGLDLQKKMYEKAIVNTIVNRMCGAILEPMFQGADAVKEISELGLAFDAYQLALADITHTE